MRDRRYFFYTLVKTEARQPWQMHPVLTPDGVPVRAHRSVVVAPHLQTGTESNVWGLRMRRIRTRDNQFQQPLVLFVAGIKVSRYNATVPQPNSWPRTYGVAAMSLIISLKQTLSSISRPS